MESLKRFYEPEEIHNPEMILWVGTMGLIVNLIGKKIFLKIINQIFLEILRFTCATVDEIDIFSSFSGLCLFHQHGSGHGHSHGLSRWEMPR